MNAEMEKFDMYCPSSKSKKQHLGMGLIWISLILFSFSKISLAEMKGWELYCVRDKAGMKYVLLPGTNRLKSENEIIHDKNLVNFTDISKMLRNLKKGAYLTIEGGGLKNEGSKITFPPENDEKEILSICRSQQLECKFTE